MANIFGRKTVGLALGSGADRGYAHIGVLKTLLKNNILLDYVSGTSIGAIIAAYYALTLDIAKMEKIALDIGPATLASLIDINNPFISALKGEKIRDFLQKNLFGEKTFSETKIPLRIGATVLEDGSCFVFKEGKIIDAVMASYAIPGLLPPVMIDSKHLIDGGLTSAVPTELLSEFHPDLIIGVDLYRYGLFSSEKYDLRAVLDRTYKIYLSRLSGIEHKENRKNTLILNPVTDEGPETLLFTHAEKNIKIGEEEVEKNLGKIKQIYFRSDFSKLFFSVFQR